MQPLVAEKIMNFFLKKKSTKIFNFTTEKTHKKTEKQGFRIDRKFKIIKVNQLYIEY